MRKKPISKESLKDMENRLDELESKVKNHSRIIVMQTAFWVAAFCAAIIFY